MDKIFIKINNQIIKLEILLDKEKVKEIRDDIFFNKSIVTKVKDKEVRYSYGYELESIPKDTKYRLDKHYQNYKYNIIKYSEDNGDIVHNSITPGKALVSYDYYDYPQIVDMLDELLYSKDIDIITNISQIFTYFEDLENQKNDIDPSNITSFEDLTQLKEQLEKLEQYFKLSFYYNIIKKQIDFKFLDSYSEKHLEEYQKFLDINIEINIIKLEDIPDNIIPKITEVIPSKTKILKKQPKNLYKTKKM